MSKSKGSINYLLGIEDEPVLDHHQNNFQTNKVGGKPDWMKCANLQPQCQLCRKNLPLVVQIYAPLDNSVNHRTLYLFGCINPECFGHPESWLCVREEQVDTTAQISKIPSNTETVSVTSWLDEADDWGEEEVNEGENGNSSNNNDNLLEETLVNQQVGHLSISNDTNANKGAEACVLTGVDLISAEIEVEDSDNDPVVVDTPVQPTVNIGALRNPAASDEVLGIMNPEFSSFYLNVLEESSFQTATYVDHHAMELLNEYENREGLKLKKIVSQAAESESYEKSKPSHGNDLIHKFISRVKLCPEQLLRYSRHPQDIPLLLQPFNETLPNCAHCGGPLVFELQLMPYLSQRLSLSGFPMISDPLEFSTVIVYTCQKSCWAEGNSPRREFIIVQSDTL